METLRALQAKGFNPTSVSSILASMLAQGLAEGDSTGMRTIVDEYQPLKAPSAFRKQKLREQEEKAARKAQRKQAKVVRRSKPMVEESTEPTLAQKKATLLGTAAVPFNWTPQDVVVKLSLLQAKAVYDELRKFFG